MDLALKNLIVTGCLWFLPVLLAIQAVEIRRIVV
jgi:hypothetical protein